MYRTVRTIHLCTGLLTLPFLLLYLFSGIQLAHRAWFLAVFRSSAAIERRSVPLEAGLTDARVVALRLMRRGVVRGEISGSLAAPGALRFRVVRPAADARVTYWAGSGIAEIETTTVGLSGFANRLHQLHGAWHEARELNAWAGALALLSFGLLAMGTTGLCLWFQNHGDRSTGIILLAAGMGFTITLIISMRST